MISKDEVKHVAGLARIGVTEKELEGFSHDLSATLDWIKQLDEVNVTRILPTAHITGMNDISREDNTGSFINRERIVELFPESKNGYAKVKSVL